MVKILGPETKYPTSSTSGETDRTGGSHGDESPQARRQPESRPGAVRPADLEKIRGAAAADRLAHSGLHPRGRPGAGSLLRRFVLPRSDHRREDHRFTRNPGPGVDPP